MQIDATDRAILDFLRRHARAPYGEIGEQVGLSASAAKRRVDRMVSQGVIRAFSIEVDPLIEHDQTEAWVELFCRGTVAPKELKRVLEAVPEVMEAGTVTGEADAIVKIRARGVAELERALERVRAVGSVDHTKSAVVLSRLIHR